MAENASVIRGESVLVYIEAEAILDHIGPDPDGTDHMRTLGESLGLICATDGCTNSTKARGMCDNHYRQARRQPPPPPPEPKPSGTRVHLDDLEFLMECHPTITARELAARFRVDRSAISRRLSKAGRQDLLDRLARNAELAGHSNQTKRRSA